MNIFTSIVEMVYSWPKVPHRLNPQLRRPALSGTSARALSVAQGRSIRNGQLHEEGGSTGHDRSEWILVLVPRFNEGFVVGIGINLFFKTEPQRPSIESTTLLLLAVPKLVSFHLSNRTNLIRMLEPQMEIRDTRSPHPTVLINSFQIGTTLAHMMSSTMR